MSTPVFHAHILRPPFSLVPVTGGLTVEFTAGPATSEHGPVCTELSGGDFSISFPTGSTVFVPETGVMGATINGEPFKLPGSMPCGLTVDLPQGGTISFPSGQNEQPDSTAPRPVRLSISGTGAKIILSANMGPLP